MSLKRCMVYKSSYFMLNYCNSFYLNEIKLALLLVYEFDNYLVGKDYMRRIWFG